MREVAPAQAAAPAKVAKKKSSKPVNAVPGVRELIKKAVSASNERGGVSLAAVKKCLVADGYDVEKNIARVRTAVRKLVADGTLVHTKGAGASGSFKMAKKEIKADSKAKTPASKKPAAAQKPKTAAKKTAAAKKSPKKMAKKTAAKKPALKSPKKALKKGAKTPKEVAKKAPAKKAAKPKVKKAAPKKK